MTKAPIIIGIDAGTSVIKSVAFTADGTQIAAAAIPNNYVTLPNGGAEQDMARTWTDAAATLRQLTEIIPDLPERLVAISVTGQGDGIWLISDADGEPVAPAWLWLDARAASIVEEYTTSQNYAAHYERTGTGVIVSQMSVQLAWMQSHRPEILAKATQCFHCKDWIYFKLCGDRVTDPSEANFTFGNYKTRAYHLDILDHLGIPDAKRLVTPMVDGARGMRHADSGSRAPDRAEGGNTHHPRLCGRAVHGSGGGLYDPSGRAPAAPLSAPPACTCACRPMSLPCN